MKKLLLTLGVCSLALGANAATASDLPAGAKIIFTTNQNDGTNLMLNGDGFEKTTYEGMDCIKYSSEESKSSWNQQLLVDATYDEDETYYLYMKVIGTPSETQINGWWQYANNETSTYKTVSYNFIGLKVTSDTAWTPVTMQGKWGGNVLEDAEEYVPNRITINFGEYVGTMYMTDFTLYTIGDGEDTPSQPGSDIPEGYKIVASGDQTDGNVINGMGNTTNTQVDGIECIEYTNDEAQDGYKKQLAIDLAYEPDVVYYIQMDVMGDPSETAISAWYQYVNNDEQIYEAMGYNDFNSFKVTSKEEWQTVMIQGKYAVPTEGKAEGKKANRVVINLGAYVGTMYMTNIKVYGPADDEEGDDSGAVKAIETENVISQVYNLNGVKVGSSDNMNGLAKGIYLVNGKKVLVK